jgi:hypothetical protein
MKPLRMRILRRYTSLELSSADDFYETELMTRERLPDLELSVFDVEDDEPAVVQTHAEYAASFRDAPPGVREGIAVTDCDGCDVVKAEGETAFSFTRDRHRELHFLDEHELRKLAESVVANLPERRRGADLERLRAYARERLGTRDPEWIAACEQRPTWKKWALKAS